MRQALFHGRRKFTLLFYKYKQKNPNLSKIGNCGLQKRGTMPFPE